MEKLSSTKFVSSSFFKMILYNDNFQVNGEEDIPENETSHGTSRDPGTSQKGFLSKFAKFSITKRNPETGHSAAEATPKSMTKNPGHGVARVSTIGPAAGAQLAQLQLHQQNQSYLSAPNTPNSQATNAAGTAGSQGTGSGDEVKPRSLRFTWSMKTTSSLAPDDMMK